MNPLTNMKNVQRLSEQELSSNLKTSWHDQYKNSAWVFIGGLPYDLTEGDVICVFSQYGEIVNINLVRDKATGKTKGFCFLCYEDQRSTILAVDNLNGIKILGRTIRVDHVHDYKAPKEKREMTAETVQLLEEGCAANPVYIKKEPSSPEWRKPPNLSNNSVPLKNIKNEKVKKEKKKKKTKDKKRKQSKDKSELKKSKKHSKSKRRKKSKSSSSSETSSSRSSSESSSTDSSSDSR